MEAFAVAIQSVITDSGFLAFTTGNAIMILVGLILLYLAFAKEFEPLLLGPIAFGCILANIPRNGFEEGVMALISAGISQEIFPPLIFLGVGAMTDFGPLIANPKTLLLGAAAQIGVFGTPVGTPPNTLVLGPGQYKFTDYVKAGVPLILVCFVVSLIIIPMVWPFFPGK